MTHRAPALVLLASGIVAWQGVARAAQPLPTPFPEARYQTMSAKSPFAVSTATTASAAPTPGFAAQLYVDGVAHLGTSDFVAIKSRDPDKPTVIFQEVGKSTDDGILVERIHWSDEMGKSTVDVRKGGEKATLNFDEAQMAKSAGAVPAALGAPPGMRMPIMPGQARNGPLGLQNRLFPGRPGFQPQASGQLPQGQGPEPGMNAAAQNRIETVRRRVIQSP